MWNIIKKTQTFFFFYSGDGSSKPVPSSSSETVDNRLSTQEGKQTIRNLPVPAKIWCNQWKMFTAMAGLELKDTEGCSMVLLSILQ